MEVFIFTFLLFLCSVRGQNSTEDRLLYTFTSTKGEKEFPKDFSDSSTTFVDDNATFFVIEPEKMYLPGVIISLQIHKLTLNEESGDLVIVGPGNHKEVLYGAPGLMYVQNQSSTENIQVFDKSATIIFVTRNSSIERNLKIQWEVIGTETNTTVTTPAPTTPVSEADMKALILCFKHNGQYTCDQFNRNLTDRFKRTLRDRAISYVEKNNIHTITNIRPDDISVKCFVIEDEEFRPKKRENNYLSVTITDSRNPEMPIFTTEQLKEIIKDFHYDEGSLGVAECRSFPNYWWWFYGSAIMLGIVMTLLTVCWWYSKIDSEHIFVKAQKQSPEMHNCNGVINRTFKGDDDEYFYVTKKAANDSDLEMDVPPATPKRNVDMDFTLTKSPQSSPIPGTSNRKPNKFNRNSSKKKLPNLPIVNEDAYRESAPSLASQDFTPSHSPRTGRNDNDSSNVYEELDTYVRPVSNFSQNQDTLF